MTEHVKFNLASGVYLNSVRTPQALALACEGVELTYSELAGRARALAAALRLSKDWLQPDGQLPRVAVLGSRSIDACIGVLGSAWAGATYVPISLRTPEERLAKIFSRHRFAALVADAQGTSLLRGSALAAAPSHLILSGALPEANPKVALYDLHSLPNAPTMQGPPPLSPADLAYVIFTSGTTGVPKGVMISCGAITHYLEMITRHLDLRPTDRALEVCELSFDVSVHDMFSTWLTGGSLHVLPARQVMNAVKLVRSSNLTVWTSVPSLAGMLKQVKALSAGAMPTLRVSYFAGEQLPLGTVRAWRDAAPNSVIHNLYGPTEATIVCTGQRVEASGSTEPPPEVTPIGTALPGTHAAIMDENRCFAGPGQRGELVLSGVQLAQGYLDDPDLTAAKFPVIGGRTWYLTGDRAVCDSSGVFHHLGRIDNQVKVLGHRVELEEVDAHLRAITGSDLIATIAWPLTDGNATGLVSFVGAASIDAHELIARMKTQMPSYMVPNKVLPIDSMPLNASGKVDRRALVDILRAETQ